MPNPETDVELPMEDAVEQELPATPAMEPDAPASAADPAAATGGTLPDASLEASEADYAEQQAVVGYDDEDYR